MPFYRVQLQWLLMKIQPTEVLQLKVVPCFLCSPYLLCSNNDLSLNNATSSSDFCLWNSMLVTFATCDTSLCLLGIMLSVRMWCYMLVFCWLIAIIGHLCCLMIYFLSEFLYGRPICTSLHGSQFFPPIGFINESIMECIMLEH